LPPVGGEAPSLIELERFSQVSLRQWLAAENNLRQLHRALFFAHERQRQEHSAELIDALRVSATPGQPLENWSRIIDCDTTLHRCRLRAVSRSGGRFNIGAGIESPPLHLGPIHRSGLSHRIRERCSKG
jgi:hypothetical protein